jgi:RNA polymerase sigma-70 factor, ECF subfamily
LRFGEACIQPARWTPLGGRWYHEKISLGVADSTRVWSLGVQAMSDSASDLAQLLSQARRGSAEALGEALQACRAYLLVVAQAELDTSLRAKGGASDIVQETFLEAQRDFARFSGQSEEEFLAWLRRVLLHNLSSFNRRYRATEKRKLAREVVLPSEDKSGVAALPLADSGPSPSVRAMAHEREGAVRAALEQLPEDYQQVIGLRYDQGLSFDEIATRMNRTPNAARKLWSRAVERLQQLLERPDESG